MASSFTVVFSFLSANVTLADFNDRREFSYIEIWFTDENNKLL